MNSTSPTTTHSTEQLKRLPAIRCRMGDSFYYLTTLPFSEIVRRVQRAQEFVEPKGFDDLVQRELSRRISGIRDYLLDDPQRFFNAIVVGVWEGGPTWFPLEVEPNPILDIPGLDKRFEKSLGIVELDGTEKLFTIDGQHRVEAIKEAVKRNRQLANDELAVVFVAARDDQESVQRIRRLFSRLNRWARSTQPGENIALDEDDCVAITTRALIHRYYGFTSAPGKVDPFGEEHIIWFGRSNQIPPENDYSFTSMLTLWDVTNAVSWRMVKSLGRRRRHMRPSDGFLQEMYELNVRFWDLLREVSTPVGKVLGHPGERLAGEYRREDTGGHVLFRPIGLRAFARAVEWIDRKYEVAWERSVPALANVPLDLNRPPWLRTMWSPSRGMIANKRALQEALMLYMVGAEARSAAYGPGNLLEQYRNTLDDQEANLEGLVMDDIIG